MKHYLILVGALAALSITQTTFSNSKGKDNKDREEIARRIELQSPIDRIRAYEAELKNATTEAEKKFFQEKLEVAKQVRDLFARANHVSAASRTAQPSTSKSEPAELKGKEGKARAERDHGTDLMASYGNGGRAVVEGLGSLQDKVDNLLKIYETQNETTAAEVLKKTVKEVGESPEARAGLERLLIEVLKASGDPKRLLDGILNITRGLNAKDQSEIISTLCPAGCVPNRAACHIGAQIRRALTNAGGLALSAFVISALQFNTANGQETCSVILAPVNDPKGAAKVIKVNIDSAEQPEEKFPANPQKSG